jgi:cytochrome P450
MRDDETDLDHIPGDNGPPIINQTLAFLRDAWALDDNLVERFGPVVRTRMLGRTIVLVASAERVGEVFRDRERQFSNTYGWGHVLGELFPRGLMLRDFDDHHRHRRILKTAFSRSARAGYQGLINRVFVQSLARWAETPSLLFYPAIKQALLAQATEVFLGADPKRHGEMLLSCFTDMIRASLALVRREVPGLAWRRGMQGRRKLQAFLRAEIPARREGSRPDLFSQLCRAEDEETGARLDDSEIVDHMIFLLFAAHDTTTSGITALIDELSARPELLERAAAECCGLEPTGPEGGLDWAQLGELDYVERCFREALRLNPPVPYAVRRTVRACQLGEHPLPARAPVSVLVRCPHNDPELWTEPKRFDPERFAPERAEDRNHRHAWIPFGSGAHHCLGADLATQQAKTFCYHFLRRFEIERVSSPPTKWQAVPLPKPCDGLPLRLHPRA